MSRCRLFLILGRLLPVVLFLTFVGLTLTGCKGKPGSSSSRREQRQPAKETELVRSERHLKVRSALATSNFREAEKLAQRAVQKYPEDAEARYLLAKSLLGQNKPAAARDHLEKAVTKEGDNLVYKRTLGEILDQQAQDARKAEKLDQAIAAWKRCLELQFKPRQTEELLADVLRRQGEALIRENRLEDAENLFTEAMVALPEQVQLPLAAAKLLRDSDRLLEAQMAFKKLLDRFPHLEEARVDYARLLRRMGDNKGALIEIEQVLEVAPGNKGALDLQEQLAREVPLPPAGQVLEATESTMDSDTTLSERLAILESAGDLKGQAQLLEQALDTAPQTHWATLRLAMVQDRLGNASGALSLVSSYLEARPDDERALLLQARCLQLTGQFDQALSSLQSLQDTGKGGVAVLSELGQIYAKLGKFDLATKQWKKALDLDPENASILFHFGHLSMEQGKFAEAKAYFDQAIRKEPFNLKLRYFAGLNLKQSGDSAGATSVWAGARAFLNPQDPYGTRILHALGEKVPRVAVNTPGSSDATIKPAPGIQAPPPGLSTPPVVSPVTNQSDRVIVISPPPAVEDPQYKPALEAARAGRFQEAIEGFRQILSRDPRHFNALMNLGNSFTALGRHGDAAANYFRAVACDTANNHAQKALARSYAELGLNPRTPGQTPARSNPRAFAPLTRAFLSNGLNEEALALVQTGVEENPENDELLILHGEVLHRMGQNDSAEQAFQKAQEIDKQNPLVYLKRGDLYASSNRPTEALAQYQSAAKFGSSDPDSLLALHDRFKNLGRVTEAADVLGKVKGMNLSDSQYRLLQEKLSLR
jgi:tetratricopeptide (TPR) repeat protein